MRRLVEASYRRFRNRRWFIVSIALAVVLLACTSAMRIKTDQDIRSMLPDSDRQLGASLEMVIKYTPFTRSVLIDLEAPAGASSEELIAAADQLAEAMGPPHFSKVVVGIDPQQQLRILETLLGGIPNLFSQEDADALGEVLDGDGLAEQMQHNLRELMGLQSVIVKDIIARDPLAIHKRLLARFRRVNVIPNARIADGHFISPDGRHVLLIAETQVPMTDAQGARELLDHLDSLIDNHVGKGFTVRVICGHRYTTVNSETIKSDMFRVCCISAGLLIVILVVFIRHFNAIWVVLVPVSAVAVAAGACGLLFDRVSAATIGFGAALMGISADLALHVYFTVSSASGDPGKALGRLTRPLLACTATTLGVLAVMLLSSLPLQRQLAAFSIIGLIWALLASLLVLPHMIRQERMKLSAVSLPSLPRKTIVVLWVIVMAVAAIGAIGVQFDGDLRNLGLRPASILSDEQSIRQTWGDLRGWAMVVSSGPDVQKALGANELLYQDLSENLADVEWVSLQPVLQPAETQRENQKRWSEFWQQNSRVHRLREAMASAGFASDASEQFFRLISSRVEIFTLDSLGESGLDDLIDRMIVRDAGVTRVLTLVADGQDTVEWFTTGEGHDGLQLISNSMMGRQLGEMIAADSARFVMLAIVVVTGLLVILFRRVGKILSAMVPVLTGVMCMMGIMTLMGEPLNLFNLLAGVLVIGLAVDYGIFMVHWATESLDPAIERAVLVSGLTTLAGFGALAMAQHPTMRSIGITVLSGLAPALLAALVVVPALITCQKPPDRS